MNSRNQDAEGKIISTRLVLGIGIALVIVLFVFIVGTLLGVTIFVKTWDTFRDWLPWNSATTVQVAPPNIDKIRHIGRLETLERELSTVVHAKRDYTLVDDEELIYGVCGRIVAGVDLSKLTPDDVIIADNAITLHLPPAEVFTTDLITEWKVSETEMYKVEGDIKAQIVPACDHVYKWSQSTGRDKTPELVTDAQEQALLLFQEMADDPEFLARAQRNAEDTLERLLKAAGYEEVNFVTSAAVTPTPSAAPTATPTP